MSIYTPDRWVIIECSYDNSITYKILAGWYGGFAGSNSWKLSSGIVEVVTTDYGYDFLNQSGSTYKCVERYSGLSLLTASIHESMIKQASEDANIKVRLIDRDEIPALALKIKELNDKDNYEK